ncbi:nucleotidyltransferase family protein [Zavarzinella formosa]|uniref:nucleotidyltransferase family protein n=1 Tax=Zavarzinella formosa TaxID=360055 RepID=UPI0002E8F9EF|nr:nucleotidyltransferase family protein [Zavarzinella formosa]
MDSSVISGWERTVRAVEKVRERLRRVTAALESAGIPYAVIGGNAVAEWVGRVDEAAVRNTQDVDILLRREDLPASIIAAESAGFVYRHAASIDMFLDGASGRARDAIHVIFANEKVRAEYAAPAPDVTESEQGASFRVLSFESLVRMKLTSNRDKDRMHLRDMLDVGLLDETWPARFSPELAERLQHLLDTPEG